MSNFDLPVTGKKKEQQEYEASFAKKIEDAFCEGRSRSVGTGSTGDVRIISSKDNGTEMPWVVKIRTNEPPSHATAGRTFATEWKMHQKAYVIVAKAIKENPNTYATIPQPIATLESPTAHHMILEYVGGKTLFEQALQYLLIEGADEEDTEKIRKMNQKELVALAASPANIGIFDIITQINIRWALKQPSLATTAITEQNFEEIIEKAQSRHEGVPFLSAAQYRQLERTIDLLHEHGIAHADFHPSNIIIRDDGSMAIIDFGLSKTASSPNSKLQKEDLDYLKTYKKLSL